jgi:hypothetical protein
LLGRHTTISTDHSSLRHVLSQPKLSQRQIRALEDMLEYDFDIDYLPGAKNYVQDALSRRPDYKEPPILRTRSTPREVRESSYEVGKEKMAQVDGDFIYHKRPIQQMESGSELEAELFDLILDVTEGWMTSIQKGYLDDPYCQDILRYNGPQVQTFRRRSPAETRQYQTNIRRQKARGQHYQIDEEGFIIHRLSGTLVIPNVWEIKSRTLREAHDLTVGGHFGTQDTYTMIAKRFFWP